MRLTGAGQKVIVNQTPILWRKQAGASEGMEEWSHPSGGGSSGTENKSGQKGRIPLRMAMPGRPSGGYPSGIPRRVPRMQARENQ